MFLLSFPALESLNVIPATKSQRQVEALERAAREKEAMAKERAGLAVKLAAAEREGRTLSEEAIRLR